jgi:hypothetical protein
VRQDLSADQWHAVDEGQLTGPDGRTYNRRTTRMKRKEAAALVETGRPVVTYWPGGLPEKTEVVWNDQDDAKRAWAEVRAAVTSDTPQPQGRESVATAGLWESLDGATALVLTWHH